MTSELYKKWRPKTFDAVVGQDASIRTLKKYEAKGNMPHAILVTGPTGTGKTTIGRIIARSVKAKLTSFIELNAADFRGIEMVRDIRSRMNTPALGASKAKAYLIDECHELTSGAQNAFLKLLEDPPKHVYFILCTTDPQKLISTIRNRCTKVNLKSISDKDMGELVRDIVKREEQKLSSDVVDRIVRVSEGSARNAIVLLDQVLMLDKEEEQMAICETSEDQKEAIDVCRALFNPKCNWATMSKVLKECKEDAAEGIRRAVLGYASSILLNGGPLSPRAFNVIGAFADNFLSGRAGLIACCYDIVSPAK